MGDVNLNIVDISIGRVFNCRRACWIYRTAPYYGSGIRVLSSVDLGHSYSIRFVFTLVRVGLTDYPEDINHTIDSLWLVTAIRSGVPGVVLLFVALVGCTNSYSIGKFRKPPTDDAKLARCWVY